MSYKTIHELAEGMDVANLVVKVLSQANTSPKSSGEPKPRRDDRSFSTALVGDESGSIMLAFRSARTGEVKRGRYLCVTGAVTTHNGRLQIQCGPRSLDLQQLKSGIFMSTPPGHNNLSSVTHHAGVIAARLRKSSRSTSSPPFTLEYGVQSHTRDAGQRVLYVHSVIPRNGEPTRQAACRALHEVDQDLAASMCLCANIPPVTEFHRDENLGETRAYHFHVATADCAPDDNDVQARDGDDATELVWVSTSQLRAWRHQEEGKHVYPIISKAHHALEEAVKHGVLCGAGWDDLRAYPNEDVETDEEEKVVETGPHLDQASFESDHDHDGNEEESDEDEEEEEDDDQEGGEGGE